MKFPAALLFALAAVIASVSAHHGGGMGRGYANYGGSRGGVQHGQMTGYGHGQPAHYPATHHNYHDDHHRNYFAQTRHDDHHHGHNDHHDDHHHGHNDHHDDHHHGHNDHHDDHQHDNRDHHDNRQRDNKHRHSDHHHGKDHHEEHGKGHEDHAEDHAQDDEIWRFQIGEDFGAYEYLDDDGVAKGFYIDLLMAVCRRAQKKCYYMVDSYHNCWNTRGGQELPGVGLMDHYYDGCIGLMPTPDRRNSFNFSLPFAPDYRCALHYKAGSGHANASHVTGLKIGFVEGWALSKRCFQRQNGFEGNSAGEYTPVLYESHREMIRGLLHGEVNAVLTVDVFDTNQLGLVSAGPSFKCTLGGASVMTMYGSGAIDWWNEAFSAMMEDGSYAQLCETSATTHAARGRINCL